jgi:hypothetical protein
MQNAIGKLIFISSFILAGNILFGQTVIPNSGFENWTDFGYYENPEGWDTPNEELMAIPFFGMTVVSKSNDHHGNGSFSAQVETKHLTIPPMDVPGFMTCGKILINVAAGTFTLSGGVPVVDMPTHLKGYFKYLPKGGDSCLIGILLTKTTDGIRDTVGFGYFTSKETISDWTPFSAWINYITATEPDTMNIVAISSAQVAMTVGTKLFVDDLFLDYTVGYKIKDPAAGISVYNDQETKRLIIFFTFDDSEITSIRLINMVGQDITAVQTGKFKSEKLEISYGGKPQQAYFLQIVHGNQIFTRKFFLKQN